MGRKDKFGADIGGHKKRINKGHANKPFDPKAFLNTALELENSALVPKTPAPTPPALISAPARVAPTPAVAALTPDAMKYKSTDNMAADVAGALNLKWHHVTDTNQYFELGGRLLKAIEASGFSSKEEVIAFLKDKVAIDEHLNSALIPEKVAEAATQIACEKLYEHKYAIERDIRDSIAAPDKEKKATPTPKTPKAKTYAVGDVLGAIKDVMKSEGISAVKKGSSFGSNVSVIGAIKEVLDIKKTPKSSDTMTKEQIESVLKKVVDASRDKGHKKGQHITAVSGVRTGDTLLDRTLEKLDSKGSSQGHRR